MQVQTVTKYVGGPADSEHLSAEMRSGDAYQWIFLWDENDCLAAFYVRDWTEAEAVAKAATDWILSGSQDSNALLNEGLLVFTGIFRGERSVEWWVDKECEGRIEGLTPEEACDIRDALVAWSQHMRSEQAAPAEAQS